MTNAWSTFASNANKFFNNRTVSNFVPALMSFGGSLLGNSMSMSNAKELAILQYSLARDYAKYTGSNAHQWEVSDLMKAGLNPILSANSGQTYSGSSGFGSSAPVMGNPGKESLESALAVRSTIANLENMSANTNKQRSETELINQQTKMNVLQQDYQKTVNAISDLEKQLKQHNLPYEKRMTIQREINQQREGLEVISRIKNNYQNIELMKSQQAVNQADKVLKFAETKFTNERARGFSSTESYGSGANGSLGIQGGSYGKTQNWTHHRTW